MGKSVYSIVLSDQVVEAVDRLAYARNTSRSALMNQILAEALSLSTPEQRMQSIFDRVEELVSGDCFQILEQASNAMLSIRSALQLKYKPTVRYVVQLYPDGEYLGELRVGFRTTSQSLLQAARGFCELWSSLEQEYLFSGPPGEGKIAQVPVTMEEGKWVRLLRRPDQPAEDAEEDAGRAIGCYIRAVDQVMKRYFAVLDQGSDPRVPCEEAYLACMSSMRPYLYL